MKKTLWLHALAFLAAAALLAFAAPAQNPPEGVSRKVVFTLEPDEEIMTGESSIAISALDDDVVLVLTKRGAEKGPFTVFRDGQRSGPYSDLKLAMTKAYAGRKETPGQKRECSVYSPGPAPQGAQFASGHQGPAGEVLKFQDKTFGPYAIIFSMRFTPDGSRGYFTASNNDKAWFGCSDGRTVSFGGIPTELKFSPDGKGAVVCVEGSVSMNEMQNVAKLPPDKLTEFYKEMDRRYLYTIDGKKYGPFDKSKFDGNDYWYTAASNDLYFRVGDQVYRNGALFLTSESFDRCAFYPGIDGKSYAMYTYSGIVFSDGAKFPAALDVTVVQDKGKMAFRWITLENKREIVVYQRAL